MKCVIHQMMTTVELKLLNSIVSPIRTLRIWGFRPLYSLFFDVRQLHKFTLTPYGCIMMNTTTTVFLNQEMMMMNNYHMVVKKDKREKNRNRQQEMMTMTLREPYGCK